jgi:hypothetical protein
VPGYSHSIAFRFWIRRSGPDGEGIERTLVDVMRTKPSIASAARTRRRRSRAVEWPRSSSPFTDRNSVRRIPSRAARAFISRTNASSLPAMCTASATAASLADPSSIAYRRFSTVIRSPARSPSVEDAP